MSVPTRITDLSATAASNSPAGTDTIGTSIDDYLRAAFQIIRGDLATKGADIASASTADLGAVQGLSHDITGTTTITSFGTVGAGVWKIVKFEGALTLTHNATSLILPGAANITTADGDVAIVESEGSGNWRCLAYTRASGLAISGAPFIDSTALIRGSGDATKLVRFEVDGLTTATTRVITVADINFTIGKYPTRQVFTSGSGTYTTPSGATRINVRLVGGGAGGVGGTAGGAGNAGGNTTFSTLTGTGGGAVSSTSNAGVGGAAAGGDINIPGGSGASGVQNSVAGVLSPGGMGGNSAFGGGGSGGAPGANNGGAGATNSGGGGAGGGGTSANNSGGGGGAGGYVEKIITAPAATYSYAVGTGGAGVAGSISTGGNGAAGIIIVDEWYD